jgi:glycosyltransferase involved in cell wall biosynthesis
MRRLRSAARRRGAADRPEHGVPARDEAAAERATDEACGAGDQDARKPASPCRLVRRIVLKRRRVVLPAPTRPLASPPAAAPRRAKLLFLTTEDWYFWSHRLPVARAARDAGIDVVVATRVRAHGAQICREGFALRPLAWRRRGDGPFGAARAIAAITRLYRAEQPDIIHHVALKPVLFGGLARRLAFAGAVGPAVVDSLMGLGSGFSATDGAAWLRRPLLRLALRLAVGGGAGRVIVQNPEDGAALAGFGVDRRRIALIRGSGIDVKHFRPLPDPGGKTVRVALVSRMLRQKGVLEAAAAIRRLRARGLPIELLLAGPTDPDNAGSLGAETLAALAAEPGISWLGPVADVREVWGRAAIAVLPSTYGEGVPKALLEAAACARPIVASDVPGCREVVRPGETGILVPAHDPTALAEAIAALATDAAQRRRLGQAGRTLAERAFAEEIVARETLDLYLALLAEGASGR